MLCFWSWGEDDFPISECCCFRSFALLSSEQRSETNENGVFLVEELDLELPVPPPPDARLRATAEEDAEAEVASMMLSMLTCRQMRRTSCSSAVVCERRFRDGGCEDLSTSFSLSSSPCAGCACSCSSDSKSCKEKSWMLRLFLLFCSCRRKYFWAWLCTCFGPLDCTTIDIFFHLPLPKRCRASRKRTCSSRVHPLRLPASRR